MQLWDRERVNQLKRTALIRPGYVMLAKDSSPACPRISYRDIRTAPGRILASLQRIPDLPESRLAMTANDYRAILTQDEYPDAPENEGACPVLRIDYTYPQLKVTHTGYGRDDLINGADVLNHFICRYDDIRQGIDTFARWLKIFHGGSLIENAHLDRDLTYVAYTCRELEDWFGIPTGTLPDMDEWEAYVTGDVWHFTIEQRQDISASSFDTIEEWAVIESVYGLYGHEWAEQEAQATLDYYRKAGQS